MTARRSTALLVASLVSMAFGQCDDHNIFIQSYGYSEVRPPSQILGPGALVSVIRTSPFEARLVCGPEASLGPGMRFLRSATASGGLKRMAGKSFKVDAGTVSAIKEQANYKAINTIDVTLENARIIELSDDDVLYGMQFRSKACWHAVRSRIEQGFVVTMISSALVGDVKYHIGWDYSRGQRTDMADKSLAMVDLAVMLDGEVTSTASGEIHAKGLVWGIRDDEYLSALSLPFVFTEDHQRGTRRIPADHIATIENISESTEVVVRPASDTK